MPRMPFHEVPVVSRRSVKKGDFDIFKTQRAVSVQPPRTIGPFTVMPFKPIGESFQNKKMYYDLARAGANGSRGPSDLMIKVGGDMSIRRAPESKGMIYFKPHGVAKQISIAPGEALDFRSQIGDEPHTVKLEHRVVDGKKGLQTHEITIVQQHASHGIEHGPKEAIKHKLFVYGGG